MENSLIQCSIDGNENIEEKIIKFRPRRVKPLMQAKSCYTQYRKDEMHALFTDKETNLEYFER